MVLEPVGLFTIRVWAETGSRQPLRATVRYTNDVSQGYQGARVVSNEGALHKVVQAWLNEFAASHLLDEAAEPQAMGGSANCLRSAPGNGGVTPHGGKSTGPKCDGGSPPESKGHVMPDGENENKAKGMAKEAAGTVRDKAGEMTGNEEMEAKGEAQKLEGKTQQKVGDVQGKVEDAKDEIKN